jgi:YbgC/YbaW family acyl-CoA thioester hydrolase
MATSKKFRIHLDDLDYMGIVSHYDWVRIMERHRTEACKDEWKKVLAQGLGLVVVNVQVDYKAPARYDDELEFKLQVTELGNSSFVARHDFISCKTDRTCVVGHITFACIDQKSLKPKALASEFREILEKFK